MRAYFTPFTGCLMTPHIYCSNLKIIPYFCLYLYVAKINISLLILTKKYFNPLT
jgi:hypothetical protein